jgi:hypothetical protein
MTIKQNFLRQPVRQPEPRRIVIELNPGGGSVLTTQGSVTMPQVIDALMAQHVSVWKKWIATMTTAITDPTTGQPAVKEPEATPMPEFKEEPTQ